MSNEQRIPLATAERLAMRVYDRLKPTCDQIKIGGSIRRRSPAVKDAEIVAIPTAATYRVLEQGIAAGLWSKAEYGNDRTHRWGTWYRGLDLREADTVLKVECFFTEGDSFGYIFWLRTGPGDAGKHVMSQLAKTPIRCKDGAVWYAEDWQSRQKSDGIEWISETKRRVLVPTETVWFRLLGMDYVEPADRTAAIYNDIRINLDAVFIEEAPERQQRLF